MPHTEQDRLDALHQLNLLDTPPSEAFDRITRMASQIFNLPIAAVSLTDRDRQWFKSRVGVEHDTIPREKAPCGEVADTSRLLVIPDMMADECYSSSLLAGSGVRFYAGAPLTTREGFSLGALCVLGTEARTTTEQELASLQDLAAMVMSQIELQHAFGRIDPLSGMPNRVQFEDDLHDLGRDQRGEPRIVALVDLGRTQQMDQGARVMGPAYIEDMVREAARMIRSALGPERIAYHVSATQFAFIAPQGATVEAYLDLVQATLLCLRGEAPIRLSVNAVIGLAPFTAGVTPPADVLRAAYSAAQDARLYKLGVSVYSAAADDVHQRTFTLLNDFGAALDDPHQLRLVYQPRVDLESRRCIGAEALLRWRHPLLGEISPGEFIPIIEQTAMVREVTAWVLNRAIDQVAAWQAVGLTLPLSVNISAANLQEPDFVQELQLALLRRRVRPELIELELTESAVMEDAGRALDTLTALSSLGLKIAIDDFGTGHSSLAYLQSLPVNVVKIDQSFVRQMAEGGARQSTLVNTMIRLSQDLGYRVVAEGVETAMIAATLQAMGCEEAQGYFFARPLEADALRACAEDPGPLPVELRRAAEAAA